MNIILASGSPRRRELLSGLDIDFEIRKTDTDETLPGGITPAEAVALLSRRKCEAVDSPESLVLAADTVVALEGRILGKPEDKAEAVSMLTALSGREHRVYTGIAASFGGKTAVESVSTAVRFRRLSADEILRYVDTGEPMDKAGSYGIQRLGALFVEGISGDYFNVVGLPLCGLSEMLRREFGFDLFDLSKRKF